MKTSKLVLCAVLAASLPALAIDTTSTFTVTSSVVDSCSVSATSIAFGIYSTTSATANDAVGSIIPSCTLTTIYALKLSAGAGTGATFAARKMTGVPSGTLDYSIYREVGRTSVWGDGTSGSSTVAGVGTGLPDPKVTYGRIPASQVVAVGAYADTITVTLTY